MNKIYVLVVKTNSMEMVVLDAQSLLRYLPEESGLIEVSMNPDYLEDLKYGIEHDNCQDKAAYQRYLNATEQIRLGEHAQMRLTTPITGDLVYLGGETSTEDGPYVFISDFTEHDESWVNRVLETGIVKFNRLSINDNDYAEWSTVWVNARYEEE